MRTLRVALAQINTTVGDLEGNARLILDYTERAKAQGADLVAFPELALPGYPPEDLLLRRTFIDDNMRGDAQARVRRSTASPPSSASSTSTATSTTPPRSSTTAASPASTTRSSCPTTASSTRSATSAPVPAPQVFEIAGARVGVNICEDIWYAEGPTQAQALAGAEVIININGSPFHNGKRRSRERMVATRAADNAVLICYVNLVGGQDELVFDGNSMVFDSDGEMLAHAPAFQESLLVVDLDVDGLYLRAPARPPAPLRAPGGRRA